jgi:serine phosphatase RsbU (regulator of sigma subunit)
VKPDNTHAFIEMNAFPLGASKNMKFPSCQMSIGDKCAIVFYTDGWVEALMPDGEMIGYREFAEIVAKTVKSSDNPNETLYGKLEKLTGTTSWGDDVSIVLLEFD